VTAVGLAKFSDLFPFPPDPSGKSVWATRGVILGFSLMIFAVLALAHRFWKLAAPIPFRADPEKMDLRDWERDDLVVPIYEETAALNAVQSLAAYEARALRFDRVARWLPDAEAKQVRAEADVIRAEVLATLARAKVRLLRGRTSRAFTHLALLYYLLFGLGVLAFGLGADWLASERTDAVAVQKACADARAVTTVVETKLPPICGKPLTKADAETASVKDEVQKANVALATALKDCELAAGADSTACAQIREAITALSA
jgi:hypothetical protein